MTPDAKTIECHRLHLTPKTKAARAVHHLNDRVVRLRPGAVATCMRGDAQYIDECVLIVVAVKGSHVAVAGPGHGMAIVDIDDIIEDSEK